MSRPCRHERQFAGKVIGKLGQDPEWVRKDNRNHWTCPHCHEAVESIDISNLHGNGAASDRQTSTAPLRTVPGRGRRGGIGARRQRRHGGTGHEGEFPGRGGTDREIPPLGGSCPSPVPADGHADLAARTRHKTVEVAGDRVPGLWMAPRSYPAIGGATAMECWRERATDSFSSERRNLARSSAAARKLSFMARSAVSPLPAGANSTSPPAARNGSQWCMRCLAIRSGAVSMQVGNVNVLDGFVAVRARPVIAVVFPDPFRILPEFFDHLSRKLPLAVGKGDVIWVRVRGLPSPCAYQTQCWRCILTISCVWGEGAAPKTMNWFSTLGASPQKGQYQRPLSIAEPPQAVPGKTRADFQIERCFPDFGQRAEGRPSCRSCGGTVAHEVRRYGPRQVLYRGRIFHSDPPAERADPGASEGDYVPSRVQRFTSTTRR